MDYKIKKEGFERSIDYRVNVSALEPDTSKWIEKEVTMRHLLNQRSMMLDVLVSYVDDLKRILDQYKEFRMYYWDNDPAGYDEPEVSDDEYVLSTIIDILDRPRNMQHPQILARGYRIGTPEYEAMMKEILGEGGDESRGI